MTASSRLRMAAVCAGAVGAGLVAASPAVAAGDGAPPTTVGAPVSTDLNSTGLLGGQSSQGQKPGQASPLPVGGALLGSALLGGLPALPLSAG
ncbi:MULTISPECIES: hypothetical protein [Streptomyces]|uniref:ATP-binding protein n=1 Tax=Streptomyces lichenis TaxID=2306967 RepID=A0ABT0I8V0_9ACTN|nr:hypothetical protein [Streptomyces lichenis]MCK8677750.1 hypothetical protein [Streptomyces lichenis]